jgi:DNA-binding IclR family transcriptional regulator
MLYTIFSFLKQNPVSSNEPLDATTIVKHSGVPKAKIYEVLARLIDKGLFPVL